MLGIAVPQAGGIESPAVMIDGGRAVDDLVFAVAIDIGDRQAVVALSLVVPIAPAVLAEAGRVANPTPPAPSGCSNRGS